jgi:octopine/nopaline transport system permease protein
MWDVLPRLAEGVPLTIQLVLFAELLGVMVATGTALMRLSGNPVLDWIARGYVFIFRGTPLLVQIFLIYYGLGQFGGVRESVLWPILREPYWCAILAMMLNTGAYGSEILRGAIQSVPHGQIEAARACGMGRFLTFRRITVPIAVRQALPAYGNEVILMVKGSAIVAIITVYDLMGVTRLAYSRTFDFQTYIWAAIIYLIIVEVLRHAIEWIERRITRHLKR